MPCPDYTSSRLEILNRASFISEKCKISISRCILCLLVYQTTRKRNQLIYMDVLKWRVKTRVKLFHSGALRKIRRDYRRMTISRKRIRRRPQRVIPNDTSYRIKFKSALNPWREGVSCKITFRTSNGGSFEMQHSRSFFPHPSYFLSKILIEEFSLFLPGEMR